MASSVLDALDQPIWLVHDILDSRNYARAKRTVEQAKSMNDYDVNDPYIQWVWEIQATELERINDERASD